MNTGISNLEFFDEKPSDLIRDHRQVYFTINAIAKRVRQLQLGERPQALPADGNRDPVYIAREEFLQDKLVVTERIMGAEAYVGSEESDHAEMDFLGLSDEGVSLDGVDEEE